MRMDIDIEISEIKQELEELKDTSLIKAIKNLLTYAKLNRYENSLKPLSVEELKQRAVQSNKAIEDGDFFSVEDLEAEASKW